MRILFTYLLIFYVGNTFSQLPSLSTLKHTNPDANTDVFKQNKQTSILLDTDHTRGGVGFSIRNESFPIRIAPILNSGIIANENNYAYLVNSGINLNGRFSDYATLSLNVTSAIYSADSLLQDYNFGERSNQLHFQPFFNNLDLRGNISIHPNKYFTLTTGIDNYFLGNGSRSLLLDNKSKPYPFASLKTKIWKFELLNLYQFLKEEENGIQKNKYTSTHYLSTQLGRGFNMSLFETVVFQPKDTLQNRGYELEYLNPILFYRPTEYSLGSSDNVLLGLNVNWKRKNTMVYGQFIIDDLNIAEIRAKSNWWANKYGAQFGVKGKTTLKNKSIHYLTEINIVRPFTYAHLNESQIYGNSEFPMAHPAGANFIESYTRVRIDLKPNLKLEIAYQYLLKGGANSNDTLSFGDNIYDPYTNRPNDVGYKIGGNGKFIQQRTSVELIYKLPSNLYTNLFLRGLVTYQSVNNKNTTIPAIYFGLRSHFLRDHSLRY